MIFLFILFLDMEKCPQSTLVVAEAFFLNIHKIYNEDNHHSSNWNFFL